MSGVMSSPGGNEAVDPLFSELVPLGGLRNNQGGVPNSVFLLASPGGGASHHPFWARVSPVLSPAFTGAMRASKPCRLMHSRPSRPPGQGGGVGGVVWI